MSEVQFVYPLMSSMSLAKCHDINHCPPPPPRSVYLEATFIMDALVTNNSIRLAPPPPTRMHKGARGYFLAVVSGRFPRKPGKRGVFVIAYGNQYPR